MRYETCKNCAWWDGLELTDDERGLCRARSPRFHPSSVDGGGTHGEWPQTLADDWCREYAPKRVGL